MLFDDSAAPADVLPPINSRFTFSCRCDEHKRRPDNSAWNASPRYFSLSLYPPAAPVGLDILIIERGQFSATGFYRLRVRTNQCLAPHWRLPGSLCPCIAGLPPLSFSDHTSSGFATFSSFLTYSEDRHWLTMAEQRSRFSEGGWETVNALLRFYLKDDD